MYPENGAVKKKFMRNPLVGIMFRSGENTCGSLKLQPTVKSIT
jgi:hypothetical protein